MKLMITTAAMALAAVSVPAAAQYGPQATPQPSAQAPQASAAQAQAPAQKPIKLSSKAQKAIVDLQTAVNKADYASVPAKLAAAQAVASTPDDKYAIAELQLKAAVAQKDNAAMAAAADG